MSKSNFLCKRGFQTLFDAHGYRYRVTSPGRDIDKSKDEHTKTFSRRTAILSATVHGSEIDNAERVARLINWEGIRKRARRWSSSRRSIPTKYGYEADLKDGRWLWLIQPEPTRSPRWNLGLSGHSKG
jgi:hypothetical protein